MKFIRAIFSNLWKLYVGVIFSFFALLTYPLIKILLQSEKGKKLSFKVFVFWSWMVRILCLYFIRTKNKIKLPEGQYIIIANHTSYLDIFLLYSVLPHNPFVFLGKSEILNYPILRSYFLNLNIPVHRNDRIKAARSIITSRKRLEEGWSLVIFPEGGIPDEGLPRVQSFKDGAFQLAKKAGLPILPITFLDNFHLLSDPTIILGRAHPGVARIVFHDLIPSEDVKSKSVEELNHQTHKIINTCIENHYFKHEK